ncbi:MAG: hypothetical protein ABIH03_02310 [Pseudomonadota bacterium]
MITADHIHELLTNRTYVEPTLLRFTDTGEVTIVPGPHLTDISWSERGREYEVVCTSADCSTIEGIDIANLTDEMCAMLAAMLNDDAADRHATQQEQAPYGLGEPVDPDDAWGGDSIQDA